VIGGAAIDGVPVRGWETHTVLEPRITAAALGRPTAAAPSGIPALTIARGGFRADDLHDRFLDTTTLGKGIAWVNGFCLGRYWSRGPQRTLYVPGPVLRIGDNELVVLELDTAPEALARFVAAPDLGDVED
jgi:beta-galactosidase